MDGVLIIRKEKGYTSHDVVAKLRGILHMKKIGHTGTLDPDAEGVLPVVLGRATKLVDLLTEKRKTYEALLHLGIETDTQDMTGTMVDVSKVAVFFGGGGHTRAAGCDLEGSMYDVINNLTAEIEKQFCEEEA